MYLACRRQQVAKRKGAQRVVVALQLSVAAQMIASRDIPAFKKNMLHHLVVGSIAPHLIEKYGMSLAICAAEVSAHAVEFPTH